MRTILIIFLFFISVNTISGQTGDGAGFYGFYDTRIGDMYGMDVQVDNFIIEFAYGGFFNEFLADGTYNVDGVNIDSKTRRWNFSYFQKPQSVEYLYLGASITNMNWTGTGNDDSYEGELKYKEFSFDPVIGIRYPFSPNIVGDLRVGYGIGISSKWIGWDEYMDATNDWIDWVGGWAGGDLEHLNDMGSLKELDGFFVGIKLCYIPSY
ncbi:MAG: hypothetical protein ACOC2M_01870 [bacterium]